MSDQPQGRRARARAEREASERVGAARQVRSWILVVLAALLLIICMQNLADVTVELLFWRVELPLIAVLAIVAVLAFLIGWIAARLGRRRGRRDRD